MAKEGFSIRSPRISVRVYHNESEHGCWSVEDNDSGLLLSAAVYTVSELWMVVQRHEQRQDRRTGR